jgi:DNA-damage-inducible protein J
MMAATALVQARIDEDVKREASEVLEKLGLSVSDVVRIVLTRTAREGALPLGLFANEQEYDAWFRQKVREAQADTRPRVSHADAKLRMAEHREKVRRRVSR